MCSHVCVCVCVWPPLTAPDGPVSCRSQQTQRRKLLPAHKPIPGGNSQTLSMLPPGLLLGGAGINVPKLRSC